MPNIITAEFIRTFMDADTEAAARLAIGVDFAAPGAIGGTTPAAGTFTTLIAASLTSAAGSALALRTGTFGTSITIASATGVPTFATGAIFTGNITFGTSASILNGATGAIGLTATGTNQSITLTPTGTGSVQTAMASGAGIVVWSIGIGSLGYIKLLQSGSAGAILGANAAGVQNLVLNTSAGAANVIGPGSLLLGGLLTNGVGVLQFPAATTSAGGIALGTDVFAYRDSAGSATLETSGNTQVAFSLKRLVNTPTLWSIYGPAGSTDLRFYNGASDKFTITTLGAATFAGSVTTGAPITGTAAAWKHGIRVAAAVALDTTQYVQLDVGGALYKLAIAV